jgi:hypothetical protein
MKISNRYKIALFGLLLLTQFAFSQKKDENIGTEVVNVVKPYSATISDAFKVKETPSLDDEDNNKKEIIQYTIFSFPVASTFTPAKGKAAGVDKTKREKLYNNYATLGFGNYGHVLGELYVTENISNAEYIAGMFRHHSSQGGIKDMVLEDDFYKTSLDLTYGNQQRDFNWSADVGYQNQIYNWYGIDQEYFNQDAAFYSKISPSHTFHNAYLAGKIGFDEGIFSEASLKFNRFWDDNGSTENRFFIKPSFNVEIDDMNIKANVIVDYVGGSFEESYFNTAGSSYGFTNFGLNPSFTLNQDELSLNIGLSLFYSADLENSDSKFFVYPNITAAYKVVGDLMILYGGADGTLQQNSYREFTNENPFLSPTLYIAPTDRPFDIFAGLKGKLAGNISYNVRASFMQEKGRALFKNNLYPVVTTPEITEFLSGYEFGNSFGVVYDKVSTVRFFGELNADLSKNVSAGVQATLSSYTVSDQAEAWNLPAMTLRANLDLTITDKWFAGANLFFVGERKDQKAIQDLFDPFVSDLTTVTLKSYFDVNANVGYQYNDRLSFFLRANNIFNKSYEPWMNYPAQQVQVMLGANYKFDF